MANEVYVGRVRSIVVLVFFSLLTLTIYWWVWWWRFNSELHRHEGTEKSGAGRFFLFLLVPVLGWFLSVWLAGRQVRRLQVNANVERLNVPIHAAIWAALVPVLGWLGAAGALQAGANRIWMRYHDVFEREALIDRRLQCPQCSSTFGVHLNSLFPQPVVCPRCGHAGQA